VADLEAIRGIYNQGIEDRIATLETDTKSPDDIAAWWSEHDDRYAVVVAVEERAVVGWASLNRFSHRCAHSAIADLSVYVARSERGIGIGKILLSDIEQRACGSFHKIVLHALNDNVAGKRLYAAAGFREVGVFREHGQLDGRLVDVVAMEKLMV
jgi:L-amino acid N-acyltransferase YncA